MKLLLERAELPWAAAHPHPCPNPHHCLLVSAHPQAPASDGPRWRPLEAEAGETLSHGDGSLALSRLLLGLTGEHVRDGRYLNSSAWDTRPPLSWAAGSSKGSPRGTAPPRSGSSNNFRAVEKAGAEWSEDGLARPQLRGGTGGRQPRQPAGPARRP